MTDPRIGPTWSSKQVVRLANAVISDGPDLRDIKDQLFRVDYIAACWRSTDGEAWRLDWVKLMGSRVLKSGTLSGTRIDHFLSRDRPAQRPTWVNTWLTANEPKGPA